MAITNLIVKLKPEEIPEYMRDKFFELYDPGKDEHIPLEDTYVGWVHIKDDGTIEFGEPGV